MRRWLIWLLMLILSFGLGGSAQAEVTPAQLQAVTQLWQTSAHALSEVNCSSCHQAETTQTFVARPSFESCQS